jgi:hypothetical protein
MGQKSHKGRTIYKKTPKTCKKTILFAWHPQERSQGASDPKVFRPANKILNT